MLSAKGGSGLAPGFSLTSSSVSMNLKISEDAPSACWKLLLKRANFRTGLYKLNTAVMNAPNVPSGKFVVRDPVAAQ